MTHPNESRPQAIPEAAESFGGDYTYGIAEVARRAELTGHVIRAVTTMTNGRIKVQHYASLHAAVRAQERAEARGCVCVLSLCRVVPVPFEGIDELLGGGRR